MIEINDVHIIKHKSTKKRLRGDVLLSQTIKQT